MYKKFINENTRRIGDYYIRITESGLVTFGPEVVPDGCSYVIFWVDSETRKVAFEFASCREKGARKMIQAPVKHGRPPHRILAADFFSQNNLRKKMYHFDRDGIHNLSGVGSGAVEVGPLEGVDDET